MTIASARQKLVHELANLYAAEHQFLEAQHSTHANASDPKLKAVIHEHISETQGQIQNLERVFASLREAPKRQHCDGAEGIVSEGKKAMAEGGTPEIRHTFIAGGGIKAEHYEMVSYADLLAGAKLMKLTTALRLLQQNREEEVRTARRLERASPRLLEQLPT